MKIIINGGNKLKGKIKLSGSKHSAIPIIISSILTKDKITLKNIPKIRDIYSICEILKYLGSEITLKENTLLIQNKNIESKKIDNKFTKKMHGTYLFMAALLARFGNFHVGMPGGCEIGDRTPYGAIYVLNEFGISLEESFEIKGKTNNLNGRTISLTDIPYKEILPATKFALILSVLAKGKTEILNAHKASEIIDLANFLKKMGANISGEGSDTIVINGLEKLSGCSYSVSADKIEAITFIVSAAITKGEITIVNAPIKSIASEITMLKSMGVRIEINNGCLIAASNGNLKGIDIETGEYPNINTDNQPIVCPLVCLSGGLSSIKENIWENRFLYMNELRKMGAKISYKGNLANIKPVKKLIGTNVKGSDIRATASLILAGLSADGTTVIDNASFIERGYENIDKKLKSLGADISVIK